MSSGFSSLTPRLPDEWYVAPLGALATVRAGGTPSRSIPAYWGGDIPWVTTAEVKGETITTTQEFITRRGLDRSAARLESPGTLLVALYGQGPTRGRVAMLGIEAASNQACAAIAPRNGLLPGFLFHFLTGSYESLRALSNKGSQDNLSGALLKRFPIVVPPLPEQRAVSRALSDVDRLLGALEALIAKKRAIKQAVMQQLLTGKTRLPGFSGEWEVKRLGELATITMGQSPPSSSYNTQGEGLPLIQGNAEIEHRRTIARVWTTQASKRCDVGDLLVTVRAPVGAVGIATVNACLGRGVCGLKVVGDAAFLFHALVFAEPRWKVLEQGSTFTSANSKQVGQFSLRVPADEHEQGAIASVLSDMDAEIAALEQWRDKTRAIKQGMMQQLLTGRIRLVKPLQAQASA